jgi:2-polyprenyl-6-methoxyphenol hydroxylase-like FAD-dependent oxidoreductase
MAFANRALVVGAGIAGLCAAISLRRRGIEVDVVEKNRENGVLGIGIVLPGNSLRALHSLGVLDRVMAQGFPFGSFVFSDAAGNHPRKVPGALTAGPDYPAMMGITRPDYSAILTEAALAAGARITYESTAESFTQDAGGVDVTLTGGAQARYDILIGADGLHSAIRRKVFGDIAEPVFSGQAGWRINVPRHPGVENLHVYDGGPGGKAGLVPLRRDLMYMWLTDQTSDPTPPKGDLAALLRQKMAGFGGMIAETRDRYLVEGAKVIWKRFDLVDLPTPWYRGRILVIGDGAHATSAHLGQGAALAVEDAVVLGEELAKGADVAAVFERFMARRYERVNLIQSWSHQICRWEIEKTPNADFVGLTARAMELVKQPF